MRVPDLKSMPKFRPLPPIASAPIARIVPDSEKNHLEAPMKSNVQPRPWRSGPRAAGWETSFERPLRGQHGGEQRDERADAQREGEPLDFGGGEREQDEGGHERDHVGVHDRGEAALVARGYA